MMNNKDMAATVRQMLNDWNAATEEQRQAASLMAQIAAAEKELVMREAAAAHLKGIPARQNANAIEALCDKLTDLHIRRIEGTV